jgi:hypothetical protein
MKAPVAAIGCGYLAALAGCPASVLPTTQTAPLEYLRATLQIEIDGVTVPGAGVAQRRSSAKIKIPLPDKTKLLTFRSCHRYVPLPNPQSPFVYVYSPAFLLENDGSCVVFVTAITEQGKRFLGIVDWSADERGGASVDCNGENRQTVGASFCQSRAGLIQSVWPQGQSEVAPSGTGCGEMRKDGERYFYAISKGLCVYSFRLSSGEYHRHTTWGYDDVGVD